ncbi:MAG: 2-amino-4-hydroxy-6-hydroxymethyldihydropteridine diphosphokinase [Alphaproteobacteria bacterium]|nr:2-amino-4-hydroxy-6-hydroxymethyldihydropteridine diphosphokinase [Alphaproteobacteria bacterium]MCD8519912.1 2-amino-4-hydroxy-6-hydroxymethyldihydropteridine diphosphokinase [Alphaproteobacteria bacterium]MCD8526536.1 2-amino-4-hydroxy-6-hydroxymethyldihydropteridine diphosphokinase [Alphaproteobacteria bacterium]MCD8570824.1 2-amino-4-hydroxy-6-hydroxymethyldihydropteridine diphosphokinase [Alphaproteobacteria bacterium]
MILIALGSNLPGLHKSPEDNLSGALSVMAAYGIRVVSFSKTLITKPVPASDQPDYRNAVAHVETALSPEGLLSALLEIERRFGREREAANRNAARTLDLDILAYNDAVLSTDILDLPHPRLHERLFVLEPLCEIAPDWRHPVWGKTAAELLLEAKSGN